ncbi:MAG: UDP-N-acetylmuramoyl-L-alanine--D-glutamate ligase [Bacteroidia bacterium]|nr:UDP-N-acetylmuramoyl-L-alanine--D-glutamate ligase [Bacteroidia bacterium]NNM16513.1 UDP-N-acetylmuramoyl-L-alanine--D-glutamate ligase [Bacteroidia bacterium]
MTQNKNIIVLGAAESGVGAAVLAKVQGYNVFVSDIGSIKEEYKKELIENEILFEENNHTVEKILSAGEVIKSPGVPDNASIIRKIKAEEIPIISEIEFAGRFTDAKMICITGTNGKTTTTLLTHFILKNAGLNVGLAGNVGHSLAMQVAKKNHDYYVIELSSFQLDYMFEFRANIAVLLNITPDHLDRYDYKIENYINSKFRITQNQTSEDAFIYCADDEILNKEITNKTIQAQSYPFSIEKEEGMTAYLNSNQLTINTQTKPLTMTIYDLALQGKHNLYNSMAAGISSKILDIKNEEIRQSFSDFKNIEHRLELVNTIHGVEFINDSKATNVNSTWFALESVTKPIVWIAGGVDKGNDYALLQDLVRDKVKAIVCLGKENEKLHDAFGHVVSEIVDSGSASDAVYQAFSLSDKGDTVLLSPACASFDLFKNYEDRGWQFKQAVRAL